MEKYNYTSVSSRNNIHLVRSFLFMVLISFSSFKDCYSFSEFECKKTETLTGGEQEVKVYFDRTSIFMKNPYPPPDLLGFCFRYLLAY